MDSDLRWCWQPNPVKGIASMVFVAFVFALWVNSLDALKADVTAYEIRMNPFAKKFHIEEAGESGIKIGIFHTGNAQSGAGEDSSISELSSTTDFGDIKYESSAPSAFESRLMAALKTHIANQELVIIPPERPDTIEVYGKFLEGPGGAVFRIDSIRPDNELFRETVEYTLEKEKVFVSRDTQLPYTVLFVGGQDVTNKSWQR